MNFGFDSDGDASPRARGLPVWKLVVLAAVYFGAVRLGQIAAAANENTMPVWPSAGVAVAILFRYGPRGWPALTLGALAAYGFRLESPLAVATMAAAQTLTGVIGAAVVRRFMAVDRRWGGLAEPAGVLVAALVAPLASATVGVYLVSEAGRGQPVSMERFWMLWWTGDALGVLTVLPIVTGVFRRGREEWQSIREHRWHALAIPVAAGAVSWWVFFRPEGAGWLFAVFPVLLFAAGHPARSLSRLAALIVVAVAVAALMQDAGAFSRTGLLGGAFRLQGVLTVVMLTAFVLPFFRSANALVLPGTVMLAGWGLGGWFYSLQREAFEREDRSRLVQAVDEASRAIQDRMSRYVDALASGVGLYQASDRVSRSDWRAFAEALRVTERYPGVNGIGVIHRVAAEELPAFLGATREDGAPSFQLRAVPQVPVPGARPDEVVHYIITYIEPLAPNLQAEGLDVASERNRRAAADEAIASGEARMTDRIVLVQDGLHRSGFLLYLPLYARGTTPITVAERRAAAIGWVYAPFITEHFLDQASSAFVNQFHVQVFEGESIAPDQPFYLSPGATANRTDFEQVTTLELAGRTFTVGWNRSARFPSVDTALPVWFAVGMAGITLLMGGLVMMVQTLQRRAVSIAEERTAALTAAQVKLEEANSLQRAVLDGTVHSVISTTAEGIITTFNAGAEHMLGYSRAEMVGRQTPAILHDPEEVARRAQELTHELGRRIEPGFEAFVARSRSVESDEHTWTYVRKDGTRFPVSLSVTALRDQHGVITGFLGLGTDLTERVQATEELRQSQQMFQRLFQNAPDAILLVNADGRIDRANELSTALFGYDAGEFPGLEVAQLMPERFRARHGRHLTAYFAEPQARTMGAGLELLGLRRDGSEFPLDIMLSPIEGRHGVQTLAVIRDITDRREAERSMAESEERFRTAFESAGIGMAIIGLDGGWLRVNQAICNITGYPAEELIRTTFQDITHPDDLVTDLGLVQDLLEGRRQNYALEKRYIRRDGTIVWINLTAALVRDADGRPLQFISQIEDIHERKDFERALRESEERTRLFAEHAPAAVAMFDTGMRYLVASRQWYADYGLVGRDIIGVSHYEVFPEIGESWKVLHRRCLAGAVESADNELFERADGSRQWVSWEVRPWRDATGAVGGISIFTQDITERKKLEDNLAEARDQALEVSRLKSEFLTNMSHEIRTPMNGILGMMQALLDTPLTSAQRAMGQTVQGSAESLLLIINDVLDSAKIEAGKMELDLAPFELRDTVLNCVALLRPLAEEKGIALAVDFDPELDQSFTGDGGRLRQVLLNLIGNAIKFTPRGKVEVRVLPGHRLAHQWGLRFEVADTGIGMAPEVQQRLFQPFTQADGSTTRRFGGTGLGLAISAQLVELMKGRISCESEVGRGSVFAVEINLDHDALPDSPPGPPQRILVIGPATAQRDAWVAELQAAGHRVDTAATVAALTPRPTEPADATPDIIVIDHNLADGGDLAAVAALRDDDRLSGLAVVLLADPGGCDDGVVRFDERVRKPVRPGVLVRVVRRIARDRAGAALESARATVPPAAPPAAGAAASLAVFVAEDNPTNQIVARVLLERLGHRVSIAANGVELLRRLATEPCDVVVMDCQMPEMDGYTATERIRSGTVPGVDPALPVIALTAHAMRHDQARCLLAGMNEYLVKPLKTAELRGALERVMDARRPPSAPATPVAPPPSERIVPPSLAPDTELLPVLDHQLLATMRALPGNKGPSLLPELLEVFLRDEPARWREIERLVEEPPGEELPRLVHAYAGSVAVIGGLALRARVSALEQAAEAGDAERIRADWPETRTARVRLLAEIAAIGSDTP